MEPKLDLQMTVKLSEKKEGAQHSVIAQVQFNSDGKIWHSSAVGRGANRADAVADLARAHMPARIQSGFLKHLITMDAADPKALEPLVVPATNGDEKTSAGNESQVAKAPSSGPLPQTNSIPRQSLAEQDQKNRDLKTSRKLAGTAPEKSSSTEAKAF